jgi:hypothetical protein
MLIEFGLDLVALESRTIEDCSGAVEMTDDGLETDCKAAETDEVEDELRGLALPTRTIAADVGRFRTEPGGEPGTAAAFDDERSDFEIGDGESG